MASVRLQTAVCSGRPQQRTLTTFARSVPDGRRRRSYDGRMYEWSDEHQMLRQAVRQFVEKEIVPLKDDLEFGDLPPYDVLRRMFTSFGMDVAAREGFKARLERDRRDQEAVARGEEPAPRAPRREGSDPAFTLIPIIELCRHCPGLVTAMGVSMGLTASAINSKGTIAQRERWVPGLLTLEKVGAWAITEPGSGSDAFGSMRSTARKDGDDYLLNGSKTFITNGPYADTTV